MRFLPATLLLLTGCAVPPSETQSQLPELYFRMMESGLKKFEAEAESSAVNPSHYAAALLCAAVLHVHDHPENGSVGDPGLLKNALEYGDVLAVEDEAGRFEKKLDHHRNTYLWLESWRILEAKLDRWIAANE